MTGDLPGLSAEWRGRSTQAQTSAPPALSPTDGSKSKQDAGAALAAAARRVSLMVV